MTTYLFGVQLYCTQLAVQLQANHKIMEAA